MTPRRFLLAIIAVPLGFALSCGATLAQECSRCADTLTLTLAQAACFLSQLDEIRDRAATAPPALVNFSACNSLPAGDVRALEDTLRGDAPFIEDENGCIGDCPSPALYAFMMLDQIDCLAELLGNTSHAEPGATFDLRTCP